MSVLKIQRIKRSTVFSDEFNNLTENNEIDFSRKNIAVVYAPNGVGKTSLAQVFNEEQQSELIGSYGELTELRGENGIFHIIHDQNKRNIIGGQTEDYVMGDDIKYERELRKTIDNAFKTMRENVLIPELKNFGITKSTSKLINRIENHNIQGYTKSLANNQKKGNDIDLDDFINNISAITYIEQELEEEKIKFLIKYGDGDNSIIAQIQSITEVVFTRNERIQEVEENSDAIELLNKYPNKQQCVVCDNNDINPMDLISQKTENKRNILNSLDENIRALIEKILNEIKDDDPFRIKQILTDTITNGDITGLQTLKAEISRLINIYSNGIQNLFYKSLNEANLIENWNEYQALLNRQLNITDEDIQFIECMLNDNLGKNITLKRDDESKDIKILLDENEFLNKDRQNLHLSTGEQNFISLTFEFLKAKNLVKQIIVIDDPISSFDSIYKNKITYAIVKFFETKKLLILTHNTDLLRLLEVQKKGCYQLYLFNNVSEEVNGFIEVTEEEKDKVIYIDKMLEFIRNDCSMEIENERLFLISLVPFMRGYARFIGNNGTYNDLTKIMHGYNVETVNLTDIYSTLFGPANHFTNITQITVNDILSINLEEALCVINKDRYPLLNRVLRHTLISLYLRLSVEKVLVNKYGINKNRYQKLGDIINQAFPGAINQKRRIFFMSKKTLLNEFNHFEGNMNIVQPAIDISDTNLQLEKVKILALLEEIKAE